MALGQSVWAAFLGFLSLFSELRGLTPGGTWLASYGRRGGGFRCIWASGLFSPTTARETELEAQDILSDKQDRNDELAEKRWRQVVVTNNR